MNNSKKQVGTIKYDAKHDAYFIQSGSQVFSLFLFQIDDSLLGETVAFSHNQVNETQTFEVIQ